MNVNKTNDDQMTLRKLIEMLPFKEEVRSQLLEIIDKLTPDQRYQLSEFCWEMYEQICRIERENKQESAILEMARGGKGYTPDDFSKMGEEIIKTFNQKLESAQETEKLDEIRHQLQSVKSATGNQPVTSSSTYQKPPLSPSVPSSPAKIS